MIRPKPLLAALALVALVACAQKDSTDAKDSSVATVDGHAISRNTFEHYAKNMERKPAEDLTAEQREKVLEDLIIAQVIALQAERSGIADLSETRAALDLARLQILQRASQEEYLKDRRPSEQELRAEYDLQIAARGKTEYRASHIALASEEAARQVIAQLKAGANFAQLAKSQSIDARSRDKGGDLGWFTATDAPLENAIRTLKKGEFFQTPVKTDFGYHVAILTDTRDATQPPYDTVKDQLVQMVEHKKFQAHVESIKAKAKIKKTL